MSNTMIENELKKYDITDAKIEELKNDYMKLKVESVDDKDNYALVRVARIEIKNLRVQVEKKRKELKEESLNYGRMVDSEAKRITGQLERIETYLESQEKIVDDEKERIKIEKQKDIEQRENLIMKFSLIGIPKNKDEILLLPVDKLVILENEFQVKQEELLAIQKEHEEKKRIEEENTKQIEIERIKKEAAEKATKDTEERLKREFEEKQAEEKRIEEQKKLDAIKAEEELKKQAELKPDFEKLRNFSESLLEIELPKVQSKESNEIVIKIQAYLKTLHDKIISEIDRIEGMANVVPLALGYANSWNGEAPKEYTECENLHHIQKAEIIGRGETKYTCDICRISYKIDSSD